MTQQQNRYMIVLICLFGYTLPLCIIVVASVKTFLSFRHEAEDVRSSVRGAYERRISLENWKMAKVMMVVIGCFVVFWSPIVFYLLMILFEVEHDGGGLWGMVGHVGHVVMFTEGIVNPLVYSCKHKAFRQEFCYLFNISKQKVQRSKTINSKLLSTTL